MDKELTKLVDDSFSDYYYMLHRHRTWDYIETVKQQLLTKLDNYINETKRTKLKEAEP